jgi:arabinan endo-1,5-alpha-L-arabinosidase
MKWNSSHPDILSEIGRYNPAGYTEDVPVVLDVRLTAGNYFWQKSYSVTAKAENLPTADWLSGMVAHYGFDSTVVLNSVNNTERAILLKTGTNSRPTLQDDAFRNGKILHLTPGGSDNACYVQMPNPLYNTTIADGITLSFWVKRTDNNVWDDLFSFYNATDKSRLYMTGNTYVGYNNNTGNWIDINHTTNYKKENISVGKWHMVTITIGRKASNGVKVYIDGIRINDYVYNGSLNGKTISSGTAYDYNLLVNHIANCSKLYLGYGSFWGTPDVYMDEVILYDRILAVSEILALRQIMNRVYDIGQAANIEETIMETPALLPTDQTIYDLSGRPVENPVKGIYIRNGKKFIVK